MRGVDGRDSVVVGVRRADLVVARFARVEVVVVGVHTRVVQALALTLAEQAEAHADLELRVLGAEAARGLGEVAHVRVGGAAPAADEAQSARAGVNRPARRLEHHVRVEQAVLEDLARRALALRAVVAVLGAEPGPHVDEEVHLHPALEEPPPHSERSGHHLEDVVVAQREHLERLGPGRRLKLERVVRQRLQEVRHSAILARRHAPGSLRTAPGR